jgi:hypothetical protein
MVGGHGILLVEEILALERDLLAPKHELFIVNTELGLEVQLFGSQFGPFLEVATVFILPIPWDEDWGVVVLPLLRSRPEIVEEPRCAVGGGLDVDLRPW